ncbi:MAG: DNA-3-methyladenine glycosylase I [Phycisphaerales bacterium]|jgi:DNA-3-methyladenine glycosylase I|nr:DNA-3-methyladenine glycosylase I [Phycisphaerales bacterium]
MRCAWARSELEIEYHDREWGVPVYDERVLYEFLVLEGAQAGLSWSTILKKRDRYREVFAGFDARAVARYDQRRVERLLRDPGIVRNRLKVQSAISNAKATLLVREKHGGLNTLLWSFVGGAPIVNQRRAMSDVPSRTEQSDAMSRALKKLGFRFVGSTICYALMQATGMVNDHLLSCPRHAACSGKR